MWLNDDKVRALIAKWQKRYDDDTDNALMTIGYAECADELEELIKEQEKMLPPPSEGSERCMIYTKGPR